MFSLKELSLSIERKLRKVFKSLLNTKMSRREAERENVLVDKRISIIKVKKSKDSTSRFRNLIIAYYLRVFFHVLNPHLLRSLFHLDLVVIL